MTQQSVAIQQVRELVDKAMASSEGVVEVIEESFKILEGARLLYVAMISPSLIAPSPFNRSGAGVNALQAHQTGASILGHGSLGWSFATIEANAVCYEVDAAEASKSAKYTEQWASLSDGLLPQQGTIKFLSLAASHATAFANACLGRCKTPIAELSDDMGFIDVSRLRSKSSNFDKALDQGWHWRVLDRRVIAEIPHLASLVQESRNATSQCQSSESEVVVMLKICAEMERQATTNNNIDRDMLIKAAARSKPTCGPWVKDIVDFVQRFGGGRSGHLVKELHNFQKACGFQERVLGARFWQKLNSAHMGAPLGLTLVRAAVVKAQLCSNADQVDLNHLKGKTNLTRDADDWLQRFREASKGLEIDEIKLAQITGVADVRVIDFITKKKQKNRVGFDSFEAIGKQFIEDLRRCVNEVPPPSWLQPTKEDDKQPSGGDGAAFVERDVAGNLVDCSLLRNMQFTDQSIIKRKSDGMIFRIVGMNVASGVSLIDDESGTTTCVPLIEFPQKFVHWKLQVKEEVEDWSEHGPRDHMTHTVLVVKAAISQTLRAAWCAHDCSDLLRVLLTPRSVVARCNIKARQLKIVPATNSIMATQTQSNTTTAISLGELVEGHNFYLMFAAAPRSLEQLEQLGSGAFINPYFMVGVTSEERDANVELVSSPFPMELVHKTKLKFKQLEVPIYTNHKDISVGDKIMVYKAAKATAPAPEAAAPKSKSKSKAKATSKRAAEGTSRVQKKAKK
jgi:hypothetical protein